MKTDPLKTLNHRCFIEATARFSSEQVEFIRSKWNIILPYICQNAGFKKWGSHLLHLTLSEQERLFDACRKILVGVDEKGFKPWADKEKYQNQNILFRHFFEEKASFLKVASSFKEKKAVFWKYDPRLIQELREQFEALCVHVFEESSIGDKDPAIVELILGNLISLYPYFDPPEDHHVKLYAYRNQKLIPITYRVEVIPLVKDQVQAYGLIPIRLDPEEPSLLLFRGTPYPAARGFWTAIFSDFHPFCSIGKDIFLSGKTYLDQWVKDQKKVLSYGLSLGGILSYHVSQAYGEKVKIYAYGPPGLRFKDCRKDPAYGIAYHHISDFIKLLGYYPPSKHLKSYFIVTQKERNFLRAHAYPFTGTPILILSIETSYENKKWSRRLLINGKHSLSLMVYLGVFPWYGLYKSLQWIRHKMHLLRKRL